MVLQVIETLASKYFPTQYTAHILVAIATIFALRAYSQGRATNRERDLHARTFLVTGGFTPFGLTILQELAERGAHIITLSSDPIDSPRVALLIDVLRTTTNNEQIYAEHCDLLSPGSIQLFCKRFLTGEQKRLDALLFTHEYTHIGAFRRFMTRSKAEDNAEREQLSLASFLLTTLLLPSLLTAPAERDIRIINVVNRFYAAASSSTAFYNSLTSPTITTTTKPSSSTAAADSIFLAEGTRSLRTIILTRHLQRILDALPTAQIPQTDSNTSAIPIVNSDSQKSNIVAITVSPGISRDTVSRLLNADWTSGTGYSKFGVFLYLLILLLLHLLTKSSVAAVQTALHVLFLPTPFKLFSQTSQNPSKPKPKSVGDAPEEVLKPGSLYAECAVVKVKVPSPPLDEQEDTTNEDKDNGSGKGKGKEKEMGKETPADADANAEAVGIETLDLPDDGELGGELAGRKVWESFETALKVWEKGNPTLEELEAEAKAAAEREISDVKAAAA